MPDFRQSISSNDIVTNRHSEAAPNAIRLDDDERLLVIFRRKKRTIQIPQNKCNTYIRKIDTILH